MHPNQTEPKLEPNRSASLFHHSFLFIAHYFIVINLHVLVSKVKWINLPFPHSFVYVIYVIYCVPWCTTGGAYSMLLLLLGCLFFCASIFFLVVFDFNFAKTNVQKMPVRSLIEWFLCAHMKYEKRNSLNHISCMRMIVLFGRMVGPR